MADGHPSPDSSFLTPRPLRPLADSGNTVHTNAESSSTAKRIPVYQVMPAAPTFSQAVGIDSQMLPSPAINMLAIKPQSAAVSSPLTTLSQNKVPQSSSITSSNIFATKRRSNIASSSALFRENQKDSRPPRGASLASPFHLNRRASGCRRASRTKEHFSNRKKTSRSSLGKSSVPLKLVHSFRRASASVDGNNNTSATSFAAKRRQSGPSSLSRSEETLGMDEDEEDWGTNRPFMTTHAHPSDDDDYVLDSSFFGGIAPVDASTPVGRRPPAKPNATLPSDDDENSAILDPCAIGPVLGTGGIMTATLDDNFSLSFRTPSLRSATPYDQVSDGGEATPKARPFHAPIAPDSAPAVGNKQARAARLRRTVTSRDIHRDSILSSFGTSNSSARVPFPQIYPKTPANRTRSGPPNVVSTVAISSSSLPESSPVVATPGCLPRRAPTSLSQHGSTTGELINQRSPEDELMEMFNAQCEIADGARQSDTSSHQAHTFTPPSRSRARTHSLAKETPSTGSSTSSSKLKENIPLDPTPDYGLDTPLRESVDVAEADQENYFGVSSNVNVSDTVMAPASRKKRTKRKAKNVRFSNVPSPLGKKKKKNLIAMSRLDTTKLWMKVHYSGSEGEEELDSGEESEVDELLLGEERWTIDEEMM
ncbi:hypothetical protein FRC03_010518 [Tulasnella sp. 419]|nr:hypothetical protein FRC03_010518 [Tulasnella sp. 419]